MLYMGCLKCPWRQAELAHSMLQELAQRRCCRRRCRRLVSATKKHPASARASTVLSVLSAVLVASSSPPHPLLQLLGHGRRPCAPAAARLDLGRPA